MTCDINMYTFMANRIPAVSSEQILIIALLLRVETAHDQVTDLSWWAGGWFMLATVLWVKAINDAGIIVVAKGQSARFVVVPWPICT